MIPKLKSIKNHPGFIKYFKNTSWLMFQRILSMTVGLFVGVWVARYLGPEQYGLLAYAHAFVGLFVAITSLGLDGIVIRELVKDENKRDILLGTAFRLKLIGAFIVLVFLSIAIYFTSNNFDTNIMIFIIASSTIFQSFNVIDMYYQSKVLSKYIVYANVVALSFTALIKIILILNEAPLIAFVWVILFDKFILTMGYLYFYAYNHLSIRTWKFKKSVAYSLLKSSWPIIISSIVVTIYMKIDQVMIKEMMGSEAVGHYAGAITLSSVWYFIPIVLVASLFPAIVNAKKQSEKLYYSRLQKLYDLMFFISFAIALPMTFISDWIVSLLYGEEYILAGTVLSIHIWSGIFIFLGVVSGKWVLNENLMVNSMIRGIFGAILNIVLNFILIKKFGIEGAAIATLISYAIVNYFSLLFYHKTRISFWQQTKAFNIFRRLL